QNRNSPAPEFLENAMPVKDTAPEPNHPNFAHASERHSTGTAPTTTYASFETPQQYAQRISQKTVTSAPHLSDSQWIMHLPTDTPLRPYHRSLLEGITMEEEEQAADALSNLIPLLPQCSCPQKPCTHFVFGQGPSRTPLMCVIEGPNMQEDRNGKRLQEPEDRDGKMLQGPGGALWTNMLNSIGVQRKEVHLTPIITCRPPWQRPSVFHNPTGEQLAPYLPILYKKIAIVRPKVLITLGGVATRALLQSTQKQHNPKEVQGKFYAFQVPHSSFKTHIFPMYNPCYLYGSPNHKPKAWWALQRLLATLQSTPSISLA
ncbi:MAG: uracil-DNA glycosylase, partial [Myxococcota bacterium]